MAHLLKRLVPRGLWEELRELRRLTRLVDKLDGDAFGLSDAAQKSLVATWLAARRQGIVIPFEQVGFKAFSQFEEDRLLLYLFTTIGTSSKIVVEICAGDGRECMATNLILHHGWTGYLWDGDKSNVRRGRLFFSRHKASFLYPPSFKWEWVTRENINAIIEASGLRGDIDLLSIDVDGNDLWLWDALTQVRPRVVIIESHNPIPSHLSLTVPYDPAFYAWSNNPRQLDFRGASALALARIGARKGYRLVASHRHGFNLIFLRNDLGAGLFPEIAVPAVHDNPYTKWAQATRWPRLETLPWQEIA